jgi:hypothetical protein
MRVQSTPIVLLGAAGCAIAALATYWPSLAMGFVWDDANALRQSQTIRSLYDVVVPPPGIPRFYYRPVVFLSYIADAQVIGPQPYWFHVSSIAFHLLNTLLVLVLGRRWFRDDVVAAGGALLFAVFPTHVESVVWMSGRPDLLMTTFLLLAVLLHLGSWRGGTWLGAGALLLALLSKETAVVGVLLLPLLDWAEGRRLQVARMIPAAAATLVYFVLRRVGVGTFLGGLPQEESAFSMGLDLFRALGFYVVQSLVPWSLSPFYASVPQSGIYLVLGLVLPFIVIFAAWVAARRDTPASARTVLVCLIAWFVLTLAPSLFVIVRRSALNLLADRYLYTPSVASCLALAWFIIALARRIGAQPGGAAAAICIVALFFGAQARAYIPVWADDVSLWRAAAATELGAALPQRELATALMVTNQLDEAEKAFKAALELTSDPEGKVMLYSNLGNLYRRKSQYARAVDSFQKGIAIMPHPALLHNLGMTEIALASRADIAGEKDLAATHALNARDAFQHALKIGQTPGADHAFFQWEPAKTHALLGQVLFSLGDRTGARRHLETSLQLEPQGPIADVTRQYMQKVGQ